MLSCFSHVWLLATLWTGARKVMSMGFSRQEYQTGLPYPPPRIFPTQGSNLQLLHCKQILYCWATGKAQTLRYIPRQNYNAKRYMQPNVHAALFTITRTWKQVKCPLTDEWINIYIYIYIYTYIHTHRVEYYSTIKEWNNVTCSYMDGPRDYHTKWSKLETERQLQYISLICVI